MFDDLRKQAESNEIDLPEEKDFYEIRELPSLPGRFLGMTAVQRFIIAAMLLLMAVMLSTLCLLVTQRVVPGL